AGLLITDILRMGKVLVLELSNGKSLVIHLKMTGQLIYPGNGKKSSLSFHFSNGKIMDFNDQRLFADIQLLDDWRSLRFIQRLGPEPFGLSAEDFKRKLETKRTKIKPLLMDQAFIAGIGNLYAAESLFRAGIHPARPACSLSETEKEGLLLAIKEILKEAVKSGGSSVDTYVRLSGRKGDFKSQHKVYGRQGEPCFCCKTPIKRIPLGGRGTYFCPRCQK
ncbi:MAG: bifunctional DNA-formamidopyrimidine glycosylase/DNA-(apurinic or apyrimidinic site) lyase, partial [Candidatus Omnitrophica bacterium]|nr:bifunctional DNA-formamidopyrimidine glycosylase/DNA-(apurinic or apyrimidinic site) lyase [Candidatus Omnitrophota bacterium]